MAVTQKVGRWELGFEDWLDGKLSGEGIQLVGSSWAKKSDCSEVENVWYGAVRLLVYMYSYFEIVVLLYCELNFVYN